MSASSTTDPPGRTAEVNHKHYYWWQNTLYELDADTCRAHRVSSTAGSGGGHSRHYVGGWAMRVQHDARTGARRRPGAGNRLSHIRAFRLFPGKPLTRSCGQRKWQRADGGHSRRSPLHDPRQPLPTQPELMTFCHEGPGGSAAAAHLGLNIQTGRCGRSDRRMTGSSASGTNTGSPTVCISAITGFRAAGRRACLRLSQMGQQRPGRGSLPVSFLAFHQQRSHPSGRRWDERIHGRRSALHPVVQMGWRALRRSESRGGASRHFQRAARPLSPTLHAGRQAHPLRVRFNRLLEHLSDGMGGFRRAARSHARPVQAALTRTESSTDWKVCRKMEPSAETKTDNWTFWYRQPAEHWYDGLPLANGRIGGMVYGGVRLSAST